MKRRDFPLEMVLSYRRQCEEQQLLRLALAWNKYREGESQVEACRQKILREQEGEWGEGLLRLDEWQHREEYLGALADRLQDLQETLARLEAEVRHQEAGAARATQEREILDRLKNKQLALAEYEEARREQGEMDELALMRYVRMM